MPDSDSDADSRGSLTYPARDVFSLYCYRCGHAWFSRNEKIPKRCPRCHTSRWEHPLGDDVTCRFCGNGWKSSSLYEPCPICGRMQVEGAAGRFLHCNQCDYDWAQRRSKPPQRCPMCHSVKWREAKVNRLRCNECGHMWMNQAEQPKKCPKCQSAFWNIQRHAMQCRRCGHRWTLTYGRTPNDVRMCPSCKSRKWNEPPKIFVCYRCGETHIMKDNSRSMICPSCKGNNEMKIFVCKSCSFTWNALPSAKGLRCPRCGKEAGATDYKDPEKLEMWSEGTFRLVYESNSGFGTIYLWDGDMPVNTVYFHEMCRDFRMNADVFVAAINNRTMTDKWEYLAKEMHDRQYEYRKMIGYFEKRLCLIHEDAEVLAIHFKGMGPGAIASRFGMLPEDVKKSFDRIMDAYKRSGITVDDTIFTDNPFDHY